MTIGFGIVMLSSLFITGFQSQPQSARTVASMPSSLLSSSTGSTLDLESECSPASEQTVVQWIDMYWYPCKLSWLGVCIWPPFRRRHITYKVTVNDGIPFRDENNQVIPVANGKIRNWEVFDSTAWNQIVDSPRQLARYPDYEPIASNEYVVMVETRYRLFNDVEATLGICIQQP
jgi:hypothetical protein